MTAISLTRKACALLYSSPTSVVITENCYKSVSAALHKGIKVFILERCGIIRCRNEKQYDATEVTPLPGAPAGLLGVVTCKKQRNITQELVSLLELHDGNNTHHLLVLATAPTFWRRYQYRKFINSILLEQLLQERGKLSSLNSQLVQLRHSRELGQYQLEKARQMISGIGFDYRYITADLAPGSETVGPGGTVDVTEYEQVLPVSCAGINGISLYVQSVPEGADTGRLTIVIKRVADSKIVLEHSVAVQNLMHGWNGLGVSEVELVSIGDAVIQVSWCEADGLLLSLSNGKAERFGDADGKAMALRIYQSLQDPTDIKDEGQADKLYTQAKTVKPYMRMSPVSLPEMSGNFSYYLGYEAHRKLEKEKGFPIVTMNGETRTLQLHPIEDGLAATLYKTAIPEGTTRATCEVGTAHPQAPFFTYILMAIPSEADIDTGTYIEDICGVIKNGKLSGADDEVGAAWNAVSIGANNRRLLELDFPLKAKTSMDVVFAVIPAEDSIRFGWCRWYKFFITSEPTALPLYVNEGE